MFGSVYRAANKTYDFTDFVTFGSLSYCGRKISKYREAKECTRLKNQYEDSKTALELARDLHANVSLAYKSIKEMGSEVKTLKKRIKKLEKCKNILENNKYKLLKYSSKNPMDLNKDEKRIRSIFEIITQSAKEVNQFNVSFSRPLPLPTSLNVSSSSSSAAASATTSNSEKKSFSLEKIITKLHKMKYWPGVLKIAKSDYNPEDALRKVLSGAGITDNKAVLDIVNKIKKTRIDLLH